MITVLSSLLSDTDLHALIRALFGVQATLVGGSVAVLTFLTARWSEAYGKLYRESRAPETIRAYAELNRQTVRLQGRILRAKAFVILIPIVTVMEVLFYDYHWVDNSWIVVGMLLLYVLQIVYLIQVIGPPSVRLRFEVSTED